MENIGVLDEMLNAAAPDSMLYPHLQQPQDVIEPTTAQFTSQLSIDMLCFQLTQPVAAQGSESSYSSNGPLICDAPINTAVQRVFQRSSPCFCYTHITNPN